MARQVLPGLIQLREHTHLLEAATIFNSMFKKKTAGCTHRNKLKTSLKMCK